MRRSSVKRCCAHGWVTNMEGVWMAFSDYLGTQSLGWARPRLLVIGLVLGVSLAAAGCGASTSKGGTGGQGQTGGQGGAATAGHDGGVDTVASDGRPDTSDASTALGGCIDKVTGNNTSAAIVNQPDGVCDTYGSFTLTASAAGAAPVTNLTLFRTDATGVNLGATGGHFTRGVWTTQVGAQNVPGNYVVHLFIATSPNPAPGDFVALASPLSLTLAAGDNTFYFFADFDDPGGGEFGFGLNVWLDDANAASPTLSGFTAVPGGTVMVDGTTGCSPAYDGTCGVSAHTLATTTSPTVNLTSFVIAGVGGATAPADAGVSD
jgi:hypothetical protein